LSRRWCEWTRREIRERTKRKRDEKKRIRSAMCRGMVDERRVESDVEEIVEE
jgi:hypothetical protein